MLIVPRHGEAVSGSFAKLTAMRRAWEHACECRSDRDPHYTPRVVVREPEAKKSDPMLYSIAFLAVILVIGCGVLGGLYLVCRHARPHEEKPAKKLPMSNLK